MFDLGGKIALVTGASSGIGRATAKALAAAGARLALAARSEERLAAVAAEIGDGARIFPVDLTAPGAAEDLARHVEESFGRIDILVANAGLYFGGKVSEADPEAIDRLLATNVNGVFHLIRAVLPGMIARGCGDILATSSVSGHQAIHWEPVYSASKHAVQAFMHGLRRQVGEQGVRVLSIAPGIVLNDLWGITSQEEVDRKADAGAGLRSEDVADAVLFMLTRPRNVTIRDLVILPRAQPI